jgi:hypothetical protein
MSVIQLRMTSKYLHSVHIMLCQCGSRNTETSVGFEGMAKSIKYLDKF